MSNNYRVPAPPHSMSSGDITVVTDTPESVVYDGETTQIKLPDGNVEISFGPPQRERKSNTFDANLADDLDDFELSAISEKLLQGIAQDEASRQAWLENMSSGISLLGLEIKNPRGAAASGSNPQEGVSTIDHPLLLEATLRFQANARGELLPTDGPVKVRNDGEGDEWAERFKQALEKDLNHYLTVTAEEYYADTDRLLLMLGFCGIAFKKGFHCPIKRRPVIESIDAKDLIVSNASTNIGGAGRVTQRIMMRPSVLKRMQLLGAYRDTAIPVSGGMPQMKNPVDTKIDQVQGIAPQTYIEPTDQDRELYECYCEIEVPGHEHKDKGKETGLPLPYKVTLERESRKILEIRRNWEEDDKFCLPRNRIIAYIFVPGLGFYGIGLLNILGNSTKAVTAAWRLMIDAGMFANFPGFLYLKSLAKQLTNQFRIPPGGGMPIDTIGNDIRASVMPLPYKDPSPVFIQLIENIAQAAQRVGGTAEMMVGEGKQDAPVGTTLALIEQATKIIGSVHKRLHEAQGREFRMLKELLSEDPSALWRHNKKSKILKHLTAVMGQQQQVDAEDSADNRMEQVFLAALNDCDLVPAADPNTSSQTERYLKLAAAKQIQEGNPNIDQNEMDLRLLHVLGFDDAEALFKPPPSPGSAPPDPQSIAAQANMLTAQARIKDANTKEATANLDARTTQQDQQVKLQTAQLGVQRETIIHNAEQQQADKELQSDNQQKAADRAHEMEMQKMQNAHDAQQNTAQNAHDMRQTTMGLVNDNAQAQIGQNIDMNQSILGHHVDLAKTSMGHQQDAAQAAFGHHVDLTKTAMGHQQDATQADLQRRHDLAKQLLQSKEKTKGVSG